MEKELAYVDFDLEGLGKIKGSAFKTKTGDEEYSLEGFGIERSDEDNVERRYYLMGEVTEWITWIMLYCKNENDIIDKRSLNFCFGVKESDDAVIHNGACIRVDDSEHEAQFSITPTPYDKAHAETIRENINTLKVDLQGKTKEVVEKFLANKQQNFNVGLEPKDNSGRSL